MEYLIAILGGLLAGIINTLAGSGSAITMSILALVFHLPENVANGTNRIGVLLQSTVASLTFYKAGKLNFRGSSMLMMPTIIGAILGVWAAIVISNEQFKIVFEVMMVAMLAVVLIKPKRWVRESAFTGELKWYMIPLFIAIGFYGGFIQMGVGVLLLAALVLGAKYSIIESNAVKVVIVGVYTVIVLAIFQWKGLVDWKIGSILAIGQGIGGWLASRFATQHPKANVWAHRLLVLVILWAVFKIVSKYVFV